MGPTTAVAGPSGGGGLVERLDSRVSNLSLSLGKTRAQPTNSIMALTQAGH